MNKPKILKAYSTLTLLFVTIPSLPSFASSNIIIGDNNLVRVQENLENLPQELKSAPHAVGLIEISNPEEDSAVFCTGTHIGNGYVITAGHCFSDETEDLDDPHLIKKDTSCDNVKIYWNYRGPDEKSPTFDSISKCTHLLIAEHTGGYYPNKDYAIFKVDQAPQTSLPISTTQLYSNDQRAVTILSHPDARPLEWSGYCKIKNVFSSQAALQHLCDTESGSSGASLLMLDPNQGPSIVGIHLSGTSSGTANLGMQISYILKFAKMQGVDLLSLIQK